MGKNHARRVLVMNDIKSQNIEQVIIILKNTPTEAVQQSIINEANEIVTKYSRQIEAGQYRSVKQKKGWFFKKNQ